MSRERETTVDVGPVHVLTESGVCVERCPHPTHNVIDGGIGGFIETVENDPYRSSGSIA